MESNVKLTKAIVIVHGKSEFQMCQHIKSQLRLKMEIVAEKKGNKSIQITSIMRFLNNQTYKSKASFIKKYYDDIYINKKFANVLPKNFKIFIIMDTDDCTETDKNNFINKKMFENHWAYEYIHPIYNINNLEDVLEKSDIKYTKKGNKRKEEYFEIFPIITDPQKSDKEQIKNFSNNLKKNKHITNMHEFTEFCLNIAKENSYYLHNK